MLTTIHITVRDRVPTITAGEDVISHNSDYVAEFEFDEEWQDKVKTVYFVCEDGSYQAVVMSGNSCGVPMLDGEHRRIFVGVQAGSAEKPSVLKTTRPCCLKVKDSIADYLGQPIPDPTPDVYEQIIAMINNLTSPTWDSVQNKPFSTLGDGLTVDENGVLSAEGGSGGSANAVQYVAQTLTDEQKAQARTNIGASPIPTVRYWLNLNADNIINLYNMGVRYGIISPVDIDQTVPTGMSSPMLVIFGRMNYGRVDITVYDGAGAVWRGSLNLSSKTTDVTKTGDYVTNTALTDILQNYVTVEEWNDILPQFEQVLGTIEQALGTKLDKNQGAGNAGKILGIGADGIVVPQDKPTYTLPQATADALGGIKADAATAEDTQVVRIGTDGKLRTKPTGGSSITVDSELSSTSLNPVQNKVVTTALAEKITAPTTASVGQIIKVKSVDTAGKPTEWETVTAKLANPNALTFTGAVTGSYDGSAPLEVAIPSGGDAGKRVRHIVTVSVTEGTTSYNVTVDSNGDALNLESVYIFTNKFWGKSGSYIQISINGKELTRAYGQSGSPLVLELEKMGELQKFTNIPKPSVVNISFGDYYNGKSAVTSVGFWSASTTVNTTIEIYGVDA